MKSIQKTILNILDRYEKMSLSELNEHIAETIESPLCKLLLAANNEVVEALEELKDETQRKLMTQSHSNNNILFRIPFVKFPPITLQTVTPKNKSSLNQEVNINERELLNRISIIIFDKSLTYNLRFRPIKNIDEFSNNIDEDYPWAA